jgi:hypothetical protein
MWQMRKWTEDVTSWSPPSTQWRHLMFNIHSWTWTLAICPLHHHTSYMSLHKTSMESRNSEVCVANCSKQQKAKHCPERHRGSPSVCSPLLSSGASPMQSSPQAQDGSPAQLSIPVCLSQEPSESTGVPRLLFCLLAAPFGECIRTSWKEPRNWDFGGFD